jgi:hypothetical protein
MDSEPVCDRVYCVIASSQSVLDDYRDWLVQLPEPDFDELVSVAQEFFDMNQALINDQQTILSELLRDEPESPVLRWQHYPSEDVLDPDSGAMYYYHAHADGERPQDEHGHFHLFIRPEPTADFSHFVGVSIDPRGAIRSLFTTNRWVTDEYFRPAKDMISMLPEAFVVNRMRPSWLVSRWLMLLVRLCEPHIRQLLIARDEFLGWDGDGELPIELAENRSKQVLSEAFVDIYAVLSLVQEVGQQRYSV